MLNLAIDTATVIKTRLESQFTCKRYFREDISTFSGTKILIRISVSTSNQAKFDFRLRDNFTDGNLNSIANLLKIK